MVQTDVSPTTSATGAATRRERSSDYPVHDYIAAMTRELAQMARWDGDPQLAKALDLASEIAARPRG